MVNAEKMTVPFLIESSLNLLVSFSRLGIANLVMNANFIIKSKRFKRKLKGLKSNKLFRKNLNTKRKIVKRKQRQMQIDKRDKLLISY